MVITYLNTEVSEILVATVVSEVLTSANENKSDFMLHIMICYFVITSYVCSYGQLANKQVIMMHNTKCDLMFVVVC